MVSRGNCNSKCMATPMFIAALFIKVKTWKQCKCPLTDEWVKNMWYIYIFNTHINIHSAIKRWKWCHFHGIGWTWINLEITLNEVNQTNDISYMWNLKMIQMNFFTKQKQSHRHRKQTYSYQRRKGEGINWSMGLTNTHCRVKNR